MSALADHRFRRMLAGQGLSSFGDSALYLSLGIWVKDLTGSNGSAGAVFFALGLASLAAPLTGHLADQVRRKPLIILTDAGTALVVLSLLLVHSRHDVWIIYAVAAAYGLSFNLGGAAGAVLLKDMIADDDLAGAIAVRQVIFQGLRIVSPLLGAGLYSTVGPDALVIFDASTFAFAIAAVASVRVAETPTQTPPETRLLSRIAAGFGHLRRTPLLARLTSAGAVTMLVLGFYESLPYAVVDALHRPATYVGVLLSAQAAGSIAGGLVAAPATRRFGEKRTAAAGLACFAAGMGALTSTAASLVFTGVVLDGVAFMLFSIAFGTAVQRYTPARLQGRVSSATYLLLDIPQTVSIAVGAALIGVIDYRVLLLVMVLVISAAAAWAYRPTQDLPAVITPSAG